MLRHEDSPPLAEVVLGSFATTEATTATRFSHSQHLLSRGRAYCLQTPPETDAGSSFQLEGPDLVRLYAVGFE